MPERHWVTRVPRPDSEVFIDILAKKIKTTLYGCIEWTACRDDKGYGVMGQRGGKTTRPHRWLWEFFYGELERDEHVLHKCHNPPCCNPSHMYIGSHQDNMRDKAEHGSNKGARPWTRKLTDEQVHDALHMLAYHTPQTVVAKKLNVSNSVISDLIRKGYK